MKKEKKKEKKLREKVTNTTGRESEKPNAQVYLRQHS